jgi:hypothetical protein
VVDDEVSLTNAFCQILTIAICHYFLAILRHRSPYARQILDGAPLIPLEQGSWSGRGNFEVRAAPIKQSLIFSGLWPESPNLLLGQRHGAPPGKDWGTTLGETPQIPQKVPSDSPVGQKSDRTFSGTFVKEYMDLDRFVDVLGLLRKGYW